MRLRRSLDEDQVKLRRGLDDNPVRLRRSSNQGSDDVSDEVQTSF
jgi:hypothetical protein